MIRIGEEGLVAEVVAEQAELPEVIGDVFADVGDGAVGADDDLGVFVWSSPFSACTARAGARHDPAAFVLAFVFEVEHAGFLELLEGRFPEFEVQNFALARQEVVLDVEAKHGFKMAAQDGGGDEVGDFGGFVAAVLDHVQRVVAQLLARGLFSRSVPSVYHCEVRA